MFEKARSSLADSDHSVAAKNEVSERRQRDFVSEAVRWLGILRLLHWIWELLKSLAEHFMSS